MADCDRLALTPPPRESALRRLFFRLFAALSALRPSQRRRLVEREAAKLERSGALVFADADGWPRPPNIHGFVPTVYAVYEDGEVILRLTDPAENREGERRSHQAFAAWAEEAPERAYERLPLAGHRRPPSSGNDTR